MFLVIFSCTVVILISPACPLAYSAAEATLYKSCAALSAPVTLGLKGVPFKPSLASDALLAPSVTSCNSPTI